MDKRLRFVIIRSPVQFQIGFRAFESSSQYPGKLSRSHQRMTRVRRNCIGLDQRGFIDPARLVCLVRLECRPLFHFRPRGPTTLARATDPSKGDHQLQIGYGIGSRILSRGRAKTVQASHLKDMGHIWRHTSAGIHYLPEARFSFLTITGFAVDRSKALNRCAEGIETKQLVPHPSIFTKSMCAHKRFEPEPPPGVSMHPV